VADELVRAVEQPPGDAGVGGDLPNEDEQRDHREAVRGEHVVDVLGARRFRAAGKETIVPKPTKPTRAMAKPSSIPVRKRRMSAPSPTTPTRT